MLLTLPFSELTELIRKETKHSVGLTYKLVLAVLALRFPLKPGLTEGEPVDTTASGPSDRLREPVRDTVYLVVPAKEKPEAPKKKPVGAEDIDAVFNEAAASFDGLD